MFKMHVHCLHNDELVLIYFQFDQEQKKISILKQCNRMQSLYKRIRSKNSLKELKMID